MILTGEVSGGHESRIFVSIDFGRSFMHKDLPFLPMTQITYNPENSDVLVVLSSSVSTPRLLFCFVLLKNMSSLHCVVIY